ncbi:WD40 repeat-containing protein [Planoprotostelium fungivorum]|uniref:WD40 repeat-containing protein n=1 Tax=Planoprotostelium fungivorum TaxID=1890364 RepID=A0A2P6NAR2_9EUKA|nr:WD40 repeat-containing protein [Planoprotostelium fungivorum]
MVVKAADVNTVTDCAMDKPSRTSASTYDTEEDASEPSDKVESKGAKRLNKLVGIPHISPCDPDRLQQHVSSSENLTNSVFSNSDNDEEFDEEGSEDERPAGMATLRRAKFKQQQQQHNTEDGSGSASDSETFLDTPRSEFSPNGALSPLSRSAVQNRGVAKDETIEEQSMEESEDSAQEDSETEESEGEASSSSEEEESMEGLKEKYREKRETVRALQIKMKKLLTNISSYRQVMEYEKATWEQKLQAEKEQSIQKSTQLQEQIDHLQRENEDFERQVQEISDEFEQQLQQLEDARLQAEEDKRVKHRENIENLQTLIKELTYIEEVNQELTNENAAEKVKVVELTEELELSKKVIQQMEIKMERQQEEFKSANMDRGSSTVNLNIDTSAPGSEQIATLAQQLVEERKKMESIGLLLSQIRSIALPSSGATSAEDELYKQIQAERELHEATKKQLETERARAAADKETIAKQNKRIQNLGNYRNYTLDQGKEQGSVSNFDIPAYVYVPKQPLMGTISRRTLNHAPSAARIAFSATAESEGINSVFQPPPTGGPELDIQRMKAAHLTGLKSKKSKPTLSDVERTSIFFECVDNNNPEEMNKMIKKNKNIVNSTTEGGKTALHRACILGHQSIVKLLLNNNADPNVMDEGQWSPLHCAANCEVDNTEVLKLLLFRKSLPGSRTAQVGVTNSDGNLPLHYYARSKFFNPEVFQALATRETVNRQNLFGEAPMHQCVIADREKGADILFKMNADLNLTTVKGETPLHWASRAGKVRMIRWLMDRGAVLDMAGEAGTPLAVAADEVTRREILECVAYQEAMKLNKDTSAVSAAAASQGVVTPVEPSKQHVLKQEKKRNRRSMMPNAFEKMFSSVDEDPSSSSHRMSNTFSPPNSAPGAFLDLTVNEEGSTSHSSSSYELSHPTERTRNQRAVTIGGGETSPKVPMHHTVSSASGRTMAKSFSNSHASGPELSREASFSRFGSVRGRVGDFKPNMMPLSSSQISQIEKTAKENPEQLVLIQAASRRFLAMRTKKELTNALIVRESSVKKLREIESRFVKGMALLIVNFVNPVRKNNNINKKVKESLGKLLDDIDALHELSKNTMEQLSQKLDNVSFGNHIRVGEIYVSQSPKLVKIMTKYSQDYYEILPSVLDDQVLMGKLMKSIGDQIIALPMLYELLHEPMTYDSQLTNALKTLGKATPPDHRDRKSLKTVLIRLESLHNVMIGHHEEYNQQKAVTRVLAKFTQVPGPINAPGRHLVKEGGLLCSIRGMKKRVTVVLFTDSILIGRHKEVNKFLDHIMLKAESEVHPIVEKRKGDHGFQIIAKPGDSTTFYCRMDAERDDWVSAVKGVIDKLVFAWRQPKKGAGLDTSAMSDAKEIVALTSLSEMKGISSAAMSLSRNSSRRASLNSGQPPMVSSVSSSTSVGLSPSNVSIPSSPTMRASNSKDFNSEVVKALKESGSSGSSANLLIISPRSHAVRNVTMDAKTIANSEMLSVLSQEACLICYSPFDRNREKFICRRCGNAVCPSCSLKREHGRVCTSCKEHNRESISFLELPELIIVHILTFVDIHELGAVFSTCRQLSKLGENSQAWRIFWMRKGWKARPEDSSLAVSNPSYWKMRCQVESKWMSPDVPPMVPLGGHLGKVTCFSRIEDNLMISGSYDRTLRLWDVKEGFAMNVYKGHTESIRAVSLNTANRLIFSASDNHLKIWSLDTAKITSNIKIHSDPISCLVYIAEKNIIITGSSDRTVKVIDAKSLRTIKTISGHKHGINCLHYQKNTLAVGSKESIHVYDLSLLDKISTVLRGIPNTVVNAVATEGDTIISGSSDGQIRFYERHQPTSILEGHRGEISCMQHDENKIVSGSEDGIVCVWSMQKRAMVKTIEIADKQLDCLAFNAGGRLATGHSDGVVRLWKLV